MRRLKAAAVRLERMQTDGVRPWASFLEMQGGYVPKAPEQGVLALVPQAMGLDASWLAVGAAGGPGHCAGALERRGHQGGREAGDSGAPG